MVTSEISNISEICFFVMDKLCVFTTNKMQPAATEGGSWVDAISNL
jgi:hypothetical protein